MAQPISIPKYQPTEIDLDWAREMTRILREGGGLGFPSTNLFYRLSRKHKTLVLQNPDQLLDNFESFVTHCQTIDVFGAIGYAVIPSKIEEKTA